MDNILREQLRVLSLIENLPHKVVEKIEDGDGEQQENFALFKQVINALLSIRLHTRSRKNFVKRGLSFDSISDTSVEAKEVSNDQDKTFESLGALEAARAAAAATKKATFKNKRRRSTSEPGARYQHSLYSSHYGTQLESRNQYFDVEPFQMQSSSSNLHKLAALLGKAKK